MVVEDENQDKSVQCQEKQTRVLIASVPAKKCNDRSVI